MKRQSGGTCRADALPLPLALGRHFLALCSGFPLRLVDAMSLSSFSLIDSSIDFDAPLSLLFGVSPRLADRAAPAAFCCEADLAGMNNLHRLRPCRETNVQRTEGMSVGKRGGKKG